MASQPPGSGRQDKVPSEPSTVSTIEVLRLGHHFPCLLQQNVTAAQRRRMTSIGVIEAYYGTVSVQGKPSGWVAVFSEPSSTALCWASGRRPWGDKTLSTFFPSRFCSEKLPMFVWPKKRPPCRSRQRRACVASWSVFNFLFLFFYHLLARSREPGPYVPQDDGLRVEGQ